MLFTFISYLVHYIELKVLSHLSFYIRLFLIDLKQFLIPIINPQILDSL